MSDELNNRVKEILEDCKFDPDKACMYLMNNLSKESAPFRDELLLEGWKAKIRAYRHGTRVLREPVAVFKKGATAGSAVQTEASKKAHKIYEEKKANFPMIYLLYGSSISLFNATVADIDKAIESHQKQIDGNERQIRFLTDVKKLLMGTPKGTFRQGDWPIIVDLAREHGIV
jgi:hypothetical protein